MKHCPNPDCVGLARDGSVGEYVESIDRCLDCDTRLVLGEFQADPELGLEYNDLQTVFIAESVVQGHLVAAAIQAEGIPNYLKGEMLQGAVGELAPDVRQVEVQVPAERIEEARRIAERFERASVTGDEDVEAMAEGVAAGVRGELGAVGET